MTEPDGNPYRAPAMAPLAVEESLPTAEEDAKLAFLRRERRGYALTAGILSLAAGAVTAPILVFAILGTIEEGTPFSALIWLAIVTVFLASFLVGGWMSCRGIGGGLALSSAAWAAWTGLLAFVAIAIEGDTSRYVSLEPPVVMLLCVLALPGSLALLAAHTAWRVGGEIRRREATLSSARAGPQ